MDTKKFEGFVINEAAKKRKKGFGLIKIYEYPGGSGDHGLVNPATLVLGKAYTKEEVEAILREAISKTNDRGAVDVLTIKNIAERNGIKP